MLQKNKIVTNQTWNENFIPNSAASDICSWTKLDMVSILGHLFEKNNTAWLPYVFFQMEWNSYLYYVNNWEISAR